MKRSVEENGTDPEPFFSTILPQAGAEAFRIIPKSTWLQRMLLPHATLKIEIEKNGSTNGDALDYLSITDEFSLPISRKQDLTARWKRGVDAPTRVIFTLLSKDQPISKLLISYPRSETF